MSSSFTMPRRIISGENALESMEVRKIFRVSGKKALVVTGPNLVRLENFTSLKNILKEEKIEYEVFSDIHGEPDDKMAKAALAVYQSCGCDFLIALGGGSPLDLMKAVAVLTDRDGELSDYLGKDIEGRVPVMIAIPTTAGTGSEATPFSIITDTKKDIKMLLKGSALMPEYAVIDPRFTATAPPPVTAATGLDALCHCVEAYTSRKAQPLTDTFALSAVKRIFLNLPVCYAGSEDNTEKVQAARIQMSLAALEAGIAFGNSSVTIIHGMSRPIGALFHVPHGISNAMLMEECLIFALPGAYGRFAALGRAIGAAQVQDNDKNAAEKFLAAVAGLKKKVHIPSLQEYGIDMGRYSASIEKMAQDAMDSGSPGNTIRDVTKEDVIRIYQRLAAI